MTVPEKILGALKTAVLWAHEQSATHDWFSWLWHGLLFVPCGLLLAWEPALAGFVVFGYREGEQVMFRILAGQRLTWIDHVMDVVVPGLVGLLLIP